MADVLEIMRENLLMVVGNRPVLRKQIRAAKTREEMDDVAVLVAMAL